MDNIEKLNQFLEQTIQRIITSYPHLFNNSLESAMRSGIREYRKLVENHHYQDIKGINAHLHGDLSDNFLQDQDDKIWLIDWENSEYGDIVEEISWFLSVNEFTKDQRKIFFTEYQKCFPQTKTMKLEDLYKVYSASTPIFNICWGLNQLDMNIREKLEPERKLNDLMITAKEWINFYSTQTSKKIIEGIELLIQSQNSI